MATAIVLNTANQRDSQTGRNGAWVKKYNFTLDSSGYVPNSSNTAHAFDGTASDTLVLGILPAGLELHTCLSLISTACGQALNLKVGFAYCDGVDSSAVPQDDDYFHAALASNSAARTAANNTGVAPVTLPKDAYLKLIGANAAASSACVINFLVSGEYKGV